MKTYKSGISLIVLVVTIIVITILASAVIITLSNSNIMQNANEATFKNDMSSYKEAFELYVAREMADEKGDFNRAEDITIDGFKSYLGNNLKAKYEAGLKVVKGKLIYKTQDATLKQILQEIGMSEQPTALSEIKVGDLVEYIPTAIPTTQYPGATYVLDSDEDSDRYDTYIESETTYKPGNMTWIYLGQDESGNILLTSRETTSFTVTIGGQDGWVTGPDRIDTLCNTLYGNSTYGIARNMKIEDVERVLGYNGTRGEYTSADGSVPVEPEHMTIGAIDKSIWPDVDVPEDYRIPPRLSETPVADYPSEYKEFVGTNYKDASTDEYKAIFNQANSNSFLSNYWLSSSFAHLVTGFAWGWGAFNVRSISEGEVSYYPLYTSWSYSADASWPSMPHKSSADCALRPVIVLNTNIQFGEKNADGEWTLIEI